MRYLLLAVVLAASGCTHHVMADTLCTTWYVPFDSTGLDYDKCMRANHESLVLDEPCSISDH